MEELIKIAKEQIEKLIDIQSEYGVEDIIKSEISKEIRNWSEFIYKLKTK